VWQINAVFHHMLYQLPLLIVLVTGLIVVGARRERAGRRRAGLALAGLVILALDAVVPVLWSVFSLSVMSPHDVSPDRYVTYLTAINVALSAFTAAGIALLIAAAIIDPHRGHDPAGAGPAPARLTPDHPGPDQPA
jgi:hypothetical protein